MPSLARIPQLTQITLIVLLAAPMWVAAQTGGVVVLEEGDFERAPAAAAIREGGTPSVAPTRPSGSGEVHLFDPKRDAKADIRLALQVAARDKKHVLLEVGGEWCPFCKLLDRFFAEQSAVLALRQRNFVYVKVNFSKENQNEDALADYPLIRGFPHFYVLDAKGKLVTSQRVALLGAQGGYSPDRFRAFLTKFGPARP